ncbi:DUF4232 domain-containing protein [Streptomyces caniscabiei]|uniref:DUF4232 domain-containing protein n=1 Tax=Streptomyces caniscabiei TaxID=2746961 RepID=A0A927L7V7_9ACTN|nr:DUF4232 domain-containing protein [Streptomyces caniscabiei]MBD9726411.1 DUF4232 domain-containing protein [Streptomyces caniscabiei]MDX3511733.1 DUF4232 domain-containing protein [Streptomyces caniscabiei]MDX3719282.1 DUF4232 domain-containing protein [Streptomyces caniscabiei]WEO29577.1 DUF4232 domain-containing protein [Streptomyces caniscabiei]
MAHTARSRRITAVLAACSLGIVALTACEGGSDKAAAAPSTSASAPGKDAGKGSGSDKGADATASPEGDGGTGGSGGSSGSGGGTPPSKAGSGGSGSDKSGSKESGADDDQDGGVGMCETTDLTYNVTVASSPANHALLTATNNTGDPCLLSANDLVITIPDLDGAAEHRGPTVDDWLLNPGERAYAGILFAGAGTEGGKTADHVEIALTAAESPTTVTITNGPVTVNDGTVTSFLGTAEDALSY